MFPYHTMCQQAMYAQLKLFAYKGLIKANVKPTKKDTCKIAKCPYSVGIRQIGMNPLTLKDRKYGTPTSKRQSYINKKTIIK